MATESALLFRKETQAHLNLDHRPAVSPEILTGIYTAHYRHVLQICRGFFRQQEDAGDDGENRVLYFRGSEQKSRRNHKLYRYSAVSRGRYDKSES